jgi:ribokinase
MGRVFVAGSINMDVVATAERHPRLGETITGDAVLYFPGGKGANQAVAAAKLGAPTALIGRLGKDAFGDQLKAFLATQGVDLSLVQQASDAHTGTALITIANADNTIVVVPGANALVSAADVAMPVLAKGDIAVSQFEIPLPSISAFFLRARAAGATTQSKRNANYSISSIFSSSTKPSLGCWRKPGFATPTTPHRSSRRHEHCKPKAIPSA